VLFEMSVVNIGRQVAILFALIFVIIAVIAVIIYHQEQLTLFIDTASDRQLDRLDLVFYPICH
tara:strand:- start:237 stop:425 length:189 start_codon:yes stop_codon:yes gene_type:complete